MLGLFQPTESGFILEGEVQPTEVREGAACSVSGLPPGPRRHAAQSSLLDALKQYEGRKVRITVEVVERRPVDALRELIEQYRRDAEERDAEEAEDYPSVA